MKWIISKILKEELDNRISRVDYLNKIVEYLVDDTIIDFNENEIRLPFLPSRLTPNLSSIFPTTILTPLYPLFSVRVHHMFSEYCNDTYGLTENDIKYVWKEYRNIILDKINNKESINESTGKISREDYLNKVVDYLVEDTIIDFNENKIRYPFLSSSSPLHTLPLSLILIPSFRNYNKDNYGLTKFETYSVWQEYKNIILYKINEWKNRVSKGF